MLPFNKTEEFLAKIGDFSYQTAVRDLDKDPLHDKEYATLKTLYDQAADIQDELRNVQHMAMKNNLRWMDVELALASGKEPADNTIIDGFKTVEKTVEGYNETDLGPAFGNLNEKENNINFVEGKDFSKEEAIKKAEKYIGLGKDTEIQITESGKGSDYVFYSISMENKTNKQISNMDITKKGGHPIWYVLSRDVKERKIGLNEAGNIALKFLVDNKYRDLEIIESTQYDNIGVFTIIKTMDGVRVYPKSVKVKVALDNGQVLGFANNDYLRAVNSETEIVKPAITLEEARAKINPKLKVMEDRLAVIMNDLGKAVLCYEFMGTLDKDTYRIFINADSGMEEKVEKMNNVESIFQDVI